MTWGISLLMAFPFANFINASKGMAQNYSQVSIKQVSSHTIVRKFSTLLALTYF